MNLREVTDQISRYVEHQTLASSVLECLIGGETFVPNEGPLWDYKRDHNTDRISLASTVRQIVSFYNTYGGYLIYGVEQRADGSFIPVGVQAGIDQDQLRRHIKNYIGHTIEVCSAKVSARVGNERYEFNILVVPKRALERSPARFVKAGPEKSGGGTKRIFHEKDIYLRDSDECRPAEGPDDHIFLGGRRDFAARPADLTVDHNLPDRSQICPRFIGRNSILTSLWEWFGNYLGYAKVLAGAGGLGKSSIAYEFASQIISDPPYGIDRVVWLTAKRQQFSGETGRYISLPETHFADTIGMLCALGEHLSFLDEELEGASIEALQYQMKEAFSDVKVLVIVDDVDSLEKDEQRRLLETTRQIAQERGKFLLTTRENPTFSSDLTLHVPGFAKEEYSAFLEMLRARGQLPKLKQEQRRKLFAASGGSPLLTESIIRLVRLGESPDRAIDEWNGADGEAARDAVLGRELEQLSPESKRVLVAACELESCSSTEISQATGLGPVHIRQSIDELQNLFLLSAPSLIEEEPRFEVNDITIRIVRERANQLVSGYSSLKGDVRRIRANKGATSRISNRRKIGHAITQALALLRDRRPLDANRTIDNELENSPNHPDLLVTRGQCLLARDGKLEEAREVLRRAYDAGQRKDLLFKFWYDAEERAGSAPGMLEVADSALKADRVTENEYWNGKKARALLSRAVTRSKAGDRSGALQDLDAASRLVVTAVHGARGHVKQEAIEDARSINDLYWDLASRTSDVTWSAIFDAVWRQVEAGDIRTIMYKRSSEALEEWVHEARGQQASDSMRNAILHRVKKVKDGLNTRRSKDREERPFSDIFELLDRIENSVKVGVAPPNDDESAVR